MARLHCRTRNRRSRNEARRRRRVVGLVAAAATLLAAMITVSGLALADSLPRGTGCRIDANGMASPRPPSEMAVRHSPGRIRR